MECETNRTLEEQIKLLAKELERTPTVTSQRRVAMRRLLQIIVVIAFGVLPPLTCAQDQRSCVQPSILNAPGETLRVQLFGAWSGQPIANADIKVESNNGIVCRKAPCPNNTKQWLGRSDDAGRVIIPQAVPQDVSTELHEMADLKEAVPGASDTWVIELFPKRLRDAGEVDVRGDKLTGLDLRGYKLIDADGEATGQQGCAYRVPTDRPSRHKDQLARLCLLSVGESQGARPSNLRLG